MELRHEYKIQLTGGDLLILRQRLQAVLERDPHAKGGSYLVRSLYFETPTDRALREKLDGVSRREKFRLRLYDGDTSLIHLEKKYKAAGLGGKLSAELTRDETERLLDGDTLWMRDDERELVRELYAKMTTQGLRPKTVVEYTREPFIYGPGDVRVTHGPVRHKAFGSRPRHRPGAGGSGLGGGEIHGLPAPAHQGSGGASGPPGRGLLQIRPMQALRLSRNSLLVQLF